MSNFKAKMHQIRFPLGLCPRPRWWSLQRFPDPLAVFKGPTSKGRKGKGEGGGKGVGKGRGGWGEERRGGPPIRESGSASGCSLHSRRYCDTVCLLSQKESGL